MLESHGITNLRTKNLSMNLQLQSGIYCMYIVVVGVSEWFELDSRYRYAQETIYHKKGVCYLISMNRKNKFFF